MRLRQLLAPLPNVGASAAVTLIFLLFFVGLCWFVYQRSRKSIYEQIQQLPLEED